MCQAGVSLAYALMENHGSPRKMRVSPDLPAIGPLKGGFFRSLTKQKMRSTSAVGGQSVAETFGDIGCAQQQQQRKQHRWVGDESGLVRAQFLDRLNVKFLQRLWYSVKRSRVGAGVHEMIDFRELMRLWRDTDRNVLAVDEEILQVLFQRVDRRRRGAVRTTDIATALVLLCSDSRMDRMRTLFRIFDADDDFCLEYEEIFDMFLSIKTNDLTKDRNTLVADITFDEELSLQEAKRLYEVTIEHLDAVSEFVIFEEFSRVFQECPFLLESLLPGTFSLEWILQDYEVPLLDSPFGLDVRRGLVEALRRGDEHLELSKKRGRGMRIMQNCLDQHINLRTSVRTSPTPVECGTRVLGYSLDGFCEPRDVADGDQSDDCFPRSGTSTSSDKLLDGAPSVLPSPAVKSSPKVNRAVGATQPGYIEHAVDLPHIDLLPLDHKNAKRFRNLVLDPKTRQAYLRNKDEVNRTVRYACMVCTLNHDVRLKGVGAEQQLT